MYKRLYTMNKLFLCTLFALLLFSDPGFSQQRAIEISRTSDKDGGITFYATRNTDYPITLLIDFTFLQNLQTSTRLPNATVLNRGRTRLLKLSRQGIVTSGVNYRYNTRTFTGCINTRPSEIEYLLPFADGTTARVRGLYNISEDFGQEGPEDYYAISFLVDKDNVIYNSRRGTVVSVSDPGNPDAENITFASTVNQVVLVHDDCTFIRYSTFKDGEIFVKPGDVVNAGEPLGIVAGDEFALGNQIRMMIYYLNDDVVVMDDQDRRGIHFWKYHKPLFRTSAAEFREVVRGDLIRSVHPEDIITQEMSRRERRQWERNQ